MREGPWLLNYVPDWFVTQQQVKMWHDDSEYHDKDRLIEWYHGYNCLAPIKMAGLVYVRRKEKRDRKILGINIGFFFFVDRTQKMF